MLYKAGLICIVLSLLGLFLLGSHMMLNGQNFLPLTFDEKYILGSMNDLMIVGVVCFVLHIICNTGNGK